MMYLQLIIFRHVFSKINAQLDKIYATCRGRLINDNVVLDPKQQGYNYWELCEKVREVIHQLGFRLAQGLPPIGVTIVHKVSNHSFAGPNFSTVLNVFPHAFLQARYHETIPMSLVFIYVVVARRLGINASPANFPAVVQVHIQPPDPSEPPRLLDMRSATPLVQLSHNAIAPAMQLDEHTRPAETPMMLTRSANNIIVFMRYERTYGQSMSLPWLLESHEEAFYAASSWMFMNSHMAQFNSCPPDSKPLDVIAILLDAICPVLQEASRNVLTKYCERCLEKDEKKAASVKYRSEHPAVTYFVGLVFKHRVHNHIACIYGWDVSL
jgi:F-box protein 21